MDSFTGFTQARSLGGGCLHSLLNNLTKVSIHILPMAVPEVSNFLIALGLSHPRYNVANESLLPAEGGAIHSAEGVQDFQQPHA